MDNYKKEERRKSKRIKADFIVVYKIDKPLAVRIMFDSQETNALMVDLSEKGIAIKTDRDIPVETILLINFIIVNTAAVENSEQIKAMNIKGKVCNNTLIEAKGEVRNNTLTETNEHRLGILFTDISNENRKFIANFVKMVAKGCKTQE